MCGIAGILTTASSPERLNNSIQRMQNAIQHRGPDDTGVYTATSQHAALAHTRLSILDLSSTGHQPMATPDGRYRISFNGEIYNFQALRSQLENQGELFHSQTDTEVILRLYQIMGRDCVHLLRGMFAFAIWDDWEQTCFLARDPLGIKPLYYWQSGTVLVFASELRTVLASGLPEVKLSAEGLYGYLVNGSVPEPYTLIEQIQLLEAGHWLYWQAGNLKRHCYWQISFGVSEESISADEAIATVRQALLDSIQHHFVSDVPVGVFLSGGIDSTALVALSRQIQSGGLRTFSIGFEEPEWNEADVASKVANFFGTEHTEYRITANVGRSLLPKFLSAIDQPSIDGFNTFCVSQSAHAHGTKVVLSGVGGDELFGGYRSFQKVPQMVKLGHKIGKLQPLGIAIGAGLERWSNSSRVRRLGDFLQQPTGLTTAYQSFRGIFSNREALAITHSFLPDHPEISRQSLNSNSQFSCLEDGVSFLELSRYMRNQLLRDSDVMSMAWGLELRVPLVDRVLLERIASIPSSLRLASGKQLLTKAIPELPSYVVNRPKQGFMFPYEQWMQREWQDYFREINCPVGIPLQPWYRRWSLAILQHWWRQISA